MKMFDTLVEKALIKSPVLSSVVGLLENLAVEVHDLAKTVLTMSNTIREHAMAINVVYARQDMIMRAMQQKSTDTQLPTLKKIGAEKPN